MPAPKPETLSVPLDMQEALRGFTIVLDVRGRRRARLRLWIACHLAGLAATILGGEVNLSCEHAA